MTVNPYETTQYLAEYLLFHYGRPQDICPWPFIPREALQFHQRIVDECLLPLRIKEDTRALDIGCGVGRLTFELARVMDHAVGIDNSKSFIHAAQRLAQGRPIPIRIKETGTQLRPLTISLPKRLQKSDVEFRVGDALALPSAAPFHVVTAINLLCRIPQPRRFLTDIHRLVAPGGQFIIATPLSWLEEYTPRREWLTASQIESILRPHFRLARRKELPFIIREHRRKYQLVVSEVTTFIRHR